MGVLVSKEGDENFRIMKERSKVIDNQIRMDARKDSDVIKLLLLGTAECGKSTVLKQMKILHGIGFTDKEMLCQKMTIYQNIISAMSDILAAMNRFSIPFDVFERETDAEVIYEGKKLKEKVDEVFPIAIRSAVKNLWSDSGVHKCYLRGSEYLLYDSAKYFFDNIDRISEPNYVPNEQDILRSRVATTGITEVEFNMKNAIVRIFDVGGQRSQRRKWIHCFDNVDAVFFIASLSEYNLVLAEDGQTISLKTFLLHQLHESIMLFKKIANSQFFEKSAMILFLNKIDIFSEKIKLFPITPAFPDYKGEQTYEESGSYIQRTFEKVVQKEQKPYVHRTCATDTKAIEFVFESCFNIVVEANLKSCGV